MPGKQRLDMGGIGFKLQVLYQIPDRSGFLTGGTGGFRETV